MKIFSFVISLLCLLLVACSPDLPENVTAEFASLPERIDFNQHIRPILSDRCWSCHGPDAAARQAGLRLDTEEGAFAQLESGSRAFVPGKSGASEAIARMISEDPERRMPVPESNMTVSPKEIALISKWVEQGAEWKDHWAFLPIAPASAPKNPEGYPASNAIDPYVNERLRQEGLPANERADPERLLRRLHLDLTGLPPTPKQMDDWLADPSDPSYERIVDQLLDTDAHAEKLTMEWLDLARYADSHGLHADGSRLSYPYRDWLIQAYRDNKPFDAFVREQIAGDLLPTADQQSRIASAFNRMHPMTAEGGVIGEEMRLSYVFDRVNTVATGLLGLTMDCSRCHDHKFDPVTQAEYYGFSAFFNSFNELGMIGDDGNFGPYLLLTDSATQVTLDNYANQLQALRQERAAVTVTPEELSKFLATKRVTVPAPSTHLPARRNSDRDHGQRIDFDAWATDELTLVHDEERGGKVLAFTDPFADLYFDPGIGVTRTSEPFSISLYVKTSKRDSSLTQTIAGNTGAKNEFWRGQEFYLDGENRLNVRLVNVLPDDAIHTRTLDSLKTNRWYHLTYTYDGSGEAAGVKIYVDGRQPEQHIVLDNLRGDFAPLNVPSWMKTNGRKLRLGQAYRAFTGENGIFLGWMDDIKVFSEALTPLQVAQLADTPSAIDDRSILEEHLLRSKPAYRQALAEIRQVKARQIAIQDTLQRMMVSVEQERPRSTFVLDRGAYDAPQQEVFPTTPADVLPYPEHFPKNRLGLSEWLFLPENPLTARVAVNRYWQLIFGQGIVKTPHDFGSQGALPSHPQLLDHLAADFRDNGWDVRRLLRQLVLSEAYRRSSITTPEQRKSDPENQLLARGPSGRLPAETIRDNALAASGLLVGKTGGPSVHPYQPDGLWIQANSFSKDLLHYRADHGDRLYRRSMYTFIKRTSPPPFLTNFDASGRDVCLVQRSTTNTPLQALNLLNDPQFVETARVLAQRVQNEKTGTDEQLAHAFRLVTGRRAKEQEVTVLRQLYEEELNRFTATPVKADSLLSIGEYPVPKSLDRLKTAALASVGNVLFSFDEAYVKR